jgi:DNA-binding IclR family transcriptional regulator
LPGFPFYGIDFRLMKIRSFHQAVESGSDGELPERTSVRAVQRALRLLDCFSEVSPNLTLSECTRKTGLPVSTVSRLLATLEAEGIVRRSPDGSYSCGTRLLQIGLTALQSVSTYDLADPHLRRLTEVTGESAYLGIPSGEQHVVYVRHSVSLKSIRHSAWLGRSVPRRDTAIGTAMDGKVNASGFVATRRTIEPDVTAVAAPVRDPNGMIIAAINVVGPTFRITDQDVELFGASVVDAADAISSELGARLSGPRSIERVA